MEVKMNKKSETIRRSMFWGLSFPAVLISVLAILAALESICHPEICRGTGNRMAVRAWSGSLCSLRLFRYHGMTAEQFAWVVIKSELLYPKRWYLSRRTCTFPAWKRACGWVRK